MKNNSGNSPQSPRTALKIDPSSLADETYFA